MYIRIGDRRAPMNSNNTRKYMQIETKEKFLVASLRLAC